jgi:hypothetical protein
MRLINALIGGLAGSVTLTLLHQCLKKKFPDAPRMDLMGEDVLAQGFESAGVVPPPEDELYNLTLAGDITGNALYYSLAGIGSKKSACTKGALLGLAAGVGGVIIPRKIDNLNEEHSNKTTATQLMTVGIYLAGGLVAGLVTKALNKK